MKFGFESPTIPDLYSRRNGLKIGDRTYNQGEKIEWEGAIDERRIRLIWQNRKIGSLDEIAKDQEKYDRLHGKVEEAKQVTAEDLGI